MTKEKNSRYLFLSEEVTSSSVAPIIERIVEIDLEDTVQSELVKDYARTPILLFINSPGGTIYDGLALIDVIQSSTTPVWTICIGKGMSMGLNIFLAGKKRFIGKNATLMYHGASMGGQNDLHKMKLELKESERLQEILNKQILSKTKIKQKVLEHYIKLREDWYINPQQAIKLGFAEEYFE